MLQHGRNYDWWSSSTKKCKIMAVTFFKHTPSLLHFLYLYSMHKTFFSNFLLEIRLLMMKLLIFNLDTCKEREYERKWTQNFFFIQSFLKFIGASIRTVNWILKCLSVENPHSNKKSTWTNQYDQLNVNMTCPNCYMLCSPRSSRSCTILKIDWSSLLWMICIKRGGM